MCGLFGSVSKSLSMMDVDITKQLGMISQLRGTDSTGIFIAYTDKGKPKIAMHKEAVNATSFLLSDMTKAMTDHATTYLIAGHTRAATIGAVNNENAHPFVSEHIVGMHNGTIPNLKGKVDGVDVPDSRILFDLISEKGIEEAVTKADEGVGAYALCFLDNKAKTLNFIRNEQRPLSFIKRHDTLFWASESIFLEAVKYRNGHTQFGQIFSIMKNEMLIYDLTNHGISYKKIEPKPKQVFLPRLSFSQKDDESREESPAKIEEVSKGSAYYIGYKGKKMTVTKAKELLAKGCAYNADMVCDLDDTVYWINNSEYICHESRKDLFVTEFVAGEDDMYEGKYVKPN